MDILDLIFKPRNDVGVYDEENVKKYNGYIANNQLNEAKALLNEMNKGVNAGFFNQQIEAKLYKIQEKVKQIQKQHTVATEEPTDNKMFWIQPY